MTKAKTFLPVFLILLIQGLVFAQAAMTTRYTILSLGMIKYSTSLPLHTDGRFIKDHHGNIVYLRGVWKAEYADTTTGWWNRNNPFIWDENAARESMRTLKEEWGVNVICTFIFADWWIDDASTSLSGYPTDRSYRYCIKETLRIAEELGIYFQIRLYAVYSGEGRVTQPYPPYHDGSVFSTRQDFIDFWADLAYELRSFSNVIFTLYDEPTGDQSLWFETATSTINAIRAKGASQLIVIHWAYCASNHWMERWINEGRPTDNIVFSNHIYRFHGSYDGNPNSPVDIEYIRNQLTSESELAYKYIIDNYNIPIWVSAIGSNRGATNDQEYISFKNTLQVLNELKLGYVAYQWFRHDLMWTIQNSNGDPNRVGQALIDAIAGIPPPDMHTLSINSEPSNIQFAVNGNPYTSPYNMELFEDTYVISMPESISQYTHSVLFGNTETGVNGGGYSSYIYTAGPYNIESGVTISDINFFSMKTGEATVALYTEDNGNPFSLVVKSSRETCNAGEWHVFDIPNTFLSSGTYFLAIKINSNGMLSSTGTMGFGKYRGHSYNVEFPDPFGSVDAATGSHYSIYVPLEEIQTETFVFSGWSDGFSDPVRTIYLTDEVILEATYNPT